ncbi:hypothetical protein D3C84_429440 [compost metagenome]
MRMVFLYGDVIYLTGAYKTILQEFYPVAFCKKLYLSLEELQMDLDSRLDYYNW